MRSFKFYKEALDDLRKENIPDANGRIKRFIEIRKTKTKKKLIKADVWFYSVTEYLNATKPLLANLYKKEDNSLMKAISK